MLNVAANCDLGKKNSYMTKYVTLFNTRRLIDSSYLVGRIHTVQVKIKLVIILSHSKNNSEVTTELYCNLKQFFFLAFLAELLLSLLLFPCSRLPFAAGHKFFIDSLPKGPQLSFFRNALI